MKGITLIYTSSLLCLGSIFVTSAPFENHLRSRAEKESKFVFPLWSMLPAINQRKETQLLASRDHGEKQSGGVGIITRERAEENNREQAEERRDVWKHTEETEERTGGARELVAILERKLEEKEDEKEQSKKGQRIEAAAEGEEEDDDDEEEKLKSEIFSSAQKKSVIRGLTRELPKKVENELPEMQQKKELAEGQHKREFAEKEEARGVAVNQRKEFEEHQIRERHNELADKMAREDTEREYAEKKLTEEGGRYHSNKKGGGKQGKRVPSLEHEQLSEKDESEFEEENNGKVADERQRELSEEREKERFVEPKRNEETKDRGKGGLIMTESKKVERSREEPEELREEETESGTEKKSREEGSLLRSVKEEFLPPFSLPKRWFEHQFEKKREGTVYHGNEGRGREELIQRERERARIIHGKIEKELEKEIEGHKQGQRMEPHGLQKEREKFWFQARRGEEEQTS